MTTTKGQDFDGLAQSLTRYRATQCAVATDLGMFLDDGDTQAGLDGLHRGPLSARPAADHDDIIVPVQYWPPPSPDPAVPRPGKHGHMPKNEKRPPAGRRRASITRGLALGRYPSRLRALGAMLDIEAHRLSLGKGLEA